MNSMGFLVWILPIFFMMHDFEEIIMAEVWGKRNYTKIQLLFPRRQPFGLGNGISWQTPSFSVAVAIEFIMFSAISFLSVVYQNYIIWFSAFLGLIIHMAFIHIAVCFPFKGYVPGVVTSIASLPPAIIVLATAINCLKYSTGTILVAGILGIILLAVLLPALHGFMRVTDLWLDRYSKRTD